MTTESEVLGRPNKTLQMEIETIGAGGGSIAWVDRGGVLAVGPKSAGADPGPACYGRGGVEPTVTDANLLLRRLAPDSLRAGGVALDPRLSEEAVRRVSRQVPGLDEIRLADGIVKIAVARMVGADMRNRSRLRQGLSAAIDNQAASIKSGPFLKGATLKPCFRQAATSPRDTSVLPPPPLRPPRLSA